MGRLLVVMPHMTVFVTHPCLRPQSIRVPSPAGFLGLWHCLRPESRQALLIAGFTDATFTEALVQDYWRVWQQAGRRHNERPAT